MKENIVKIAFISDLHYALLPNTACPERRGHEMVQILSDTVKKLNEKVKPDLVLVGGDLINFPDAEEAENLTEKLAEILSELSMEYTVIRGNHDIVQERFVKYFPFKEITDVGFVRLVSFDDREMPGYNAERSEKDLKRMVEAVKNFDGVALSFQHTSLSPEGTCIYSYVNTDEILSIMRENGYRGALSGHYHNGIELFEENQLQFFVQSALCESPFVGSLLSISRDGIAKVEKF